MSFYRYFRIAGDYGFDISIGSLRMFRLGFGMYVRHGERLPDVWLELGPITLQVGQL